VIKKAGAVRRASSTTCAIGGQGDQDQGDVKRQHKIDADLKSSAEAAARPPRKPRQEAAEGESASAAKKKAKREAEAAPPRRSNA